MLGQDALQNEAKQSGGEHRHRDGKREPIRTHSHPLARSRQLAAPPRERNRHGPAFAASRGSPDGAKIMPEAIVSRRMNLSARESRRARGVNRGDGEIRAAAAGLHAATRRGSERAFRPRRGIGASAAAPRRISTARNLLSARSIRGVTIFACSGRARRPALWVAGGACRGAEGEGRAADVRDERRHVQSRTNRRSAFTSRTGRSCMRRTRAPARPIFT